MNWRPMGFEEARDELEIGLIRQVLGREAKRQTGEDTERRRK
jgi:hypothetical protein